MGEIHINNIRTYSFHGCLEEEGIIGSEYRVDLLLTASLDLSSKTDELIDTIDYVTATDFVVKEMSVRSKLLEHVAQRIVEQLFSAYPTLKSAKVSVTKINPPIGHPVESVKVVLFKERDALV